MRIETPNNNEIKLPTLLAQFREALRDEIEVAKKRSYSNAIPLTNGKRLAKIVGGYQYSFIIDSILNIPDGSPGYLVVDGKQQLDVSIIAFEGVRIFLSVPADIGTFIPYATLQSDLSILMKKLIDRIEKIGYTANPSGNRILGLLEPNIALPKSLDKNNLNEQQQNALKYSLGSELTFIWGPPGTGKTYTIGAISKELYKSARSLLLVSHTNNAVDQALENISIYLKNEIIKGLIIRVGEPKAYKYPKEIILKNQVEIREKELSDKKCILINEKDIFLIKFNDLERTISILDWLISAKPDIEALENSIKLLLTKENERDVVEAEYLSIHKDIYSIEEDLSRSKACIKEQIIISELSRNIDDLKIKIRQQKNNFDYSISELSKLNSELHILENITPIREELNRLPSKRSQEDEIKTILGKVKHFSDQINDKRACLSDAQKVLADTLATSPLMRIWKRLPKPETQQEIIHKLQDDIEILSNHLLSSNKKLMQEKTLLQKIINLTTVIEPYMNLKSLEDTKGDVKSAHNELSKLRTVIQNNIITVKSYINKRENSRQIVDQFFILFNTNPEEILTSAESKISLALELKAKYEQLNNICCNERSKLVKDISYKLDCIRTWGLSDKTDSTAENMFDSMIIAYNKALANYVNYDINMLRKELSIVKSEIDRINASLTEIEEKLKNVEKDIISNALIVASTLTKAYLDDNIQSRKFDTVILDEASMAPIPALWVSASICDKNIVLIGDFKQLPPIVLSEKETTKKWLGKDIFEKSGIKDKYEKDQAPSYFIALREQGRMPPLICSISNELFYDHKLINKSNLNELDKINNWYNENWVYNKNYVLIVDTEPVHAWVTSVVKGGNTSRLNYLSATICLDLAEQLLRKDRPKRDDTEPHRIFIISPYRAHSKLLKIMIKEQGLENDVNADTVHGFQGREAEIVIFDLVVDEPHHRVNLFMPQLDEMLKRLYNVALTRAKNRLIIVGDIDYCQKLGKKAFLGKKIIPFLIDKAHFKKVNAQDVVTEGIASRAANTSIIVSGGDVEIPNERIVVTQEAFYRFLFKDMTLARNRIVIYSPFIATDRLSLMDIHLKSAIEHKVKIYLITKAHPERSQTELQTYLKLEKHLRELGVYVIHKLRMHEKLIFIDDNILWSGSLNPLSFSSTQEIMERRISKEVFNDYAKALRLNDLIGIENTPAEYCPICNEEMMAVEGADEPFYWCCVKGKTCFSRGIDKPHPVEGKFICSKCSAPYKYHFTNNKPIWRCTINNRHYMKMFPSHLKLPYMLELIPNNELKKVYRYFKISDSYQKLKHTNKTEQPNLF